MGSFWGAVTGAIFAVIVTTLYQQWHSNVIVSRTLFKACQKTKKDFALIVNGYLECIKRICTYSESLDFLMKNNVLQSDAEHDLRAILETEPLFYDQNKNIPKMIENIQGITRIGTGLALNHPDYYTSDTYNELLQLKVDLTSILDEIRSRAVQEAKVSFFEYSLMLIKRVLVKSQKHLKGYYLKAKKRLGILK